MKRLLAFTLFFLLILGMPVFAYEYPSQVWKWDELYRQALEAGDDQGIITYGLEIIRIMETAPEGKERNNMITTRCNAVGDAYARLGNYDDSAAMFRKYQQYEDPVSGQDGMKVAKAKELQYASQIRIFTDGGDGVFYGAKHEHKNGVLYGACSDGAIRNSLDYESMVLTYQELGDPISDWTKAVFRQAQEKGLVVEFALNCAGLMDDIHNIYGFSSNLKEISQFFMEYPDVTVLLRFGAEFNLWAEPEDGAEYVQAFRYVSDYFKTRNETVAMVWSPNQESAWHVEMDDFYPGDEYVDWVGISAYSNRYFLGQEESEEYLEIVFKSGANADPVLAVQEIVQTYGDRKPILIAESGFSHYSYPEQEDTSLWALERMKEFYSYLPMIYPQIKGIAFFDQYVEGEPNNYTLQGELKETYLALTKSPRMIQQGNETSFAYRELRDGSYVNSLSGIYTYAHIYGETTRKVTYYIDGRWAGESTDMPFGVYLDFEPYGDGVHTLKAVAEGDGGTVLEQEWRLNSSNWNPEQISVVVDGETVSFDQPPVIYSDRTLVPVRAVFEAMGATVDWDEMTKTVTGVKGRRTVKLTVGSNVLRMNRHEVFLDVPAIQVNDRTLVPARAVAEGLGAKVDWQGETSTVVITSVEQPWSQWQTSLPEAVEQNREDYEIESKKQYRFRDTEYRRVQSPLESWDGWILDDEDVSYGDWSQWGTQAISRSDTLEVQTREVELDTQYLFGHYCTGNLEDESNRYQTADYRFCDECDYHELGWYDDQALTPMEDGVGCRYGDYRCDNSCYRWYVMDQRTFTQTQYCCREVTHTYWYHRTSDWSEYQDAYPGQQADREIREQTVYRWRHI